MQLISINWTPKSFTPHMASIDTSVELSSFPSGSEGHARVIGDVEEDVILSIRALIEASL